MVEINTCSRAVDALFTSSESEDTEDMQLERRKEVRICLLSKE
jgi:hypothetical protein